MNDRKNFVIRELHAKTFRSRRDNGDGKRELRCPRRARYEFRELLRRPYGPFGDVAYLRQP